MREKKAFAIGGVLILGLAAVALAGVERQSPVAGPKGEAPAQPNFAPQGCVAVPDATYDGSIASMGCFTVPGISATITDVDVIVGLNHTWVGDMVVKLQNPAATTTVTLVSRPGMVEPADDGTGCCGDSSDLVSTSPITFNDDGGGPSAETMGGAIPGVICLDDGICEFTPNAGAATPGNLSAFDGQNAAGTWNLCVGDAVGGDVGDICSVAVIFNGLAADLAMDKSAPDGVADLGPFDYLLQVTNNGPADATNVVVTDSLPAELVYVADDCGGSIAGQDFTWNAGTVTNGATVVCTLTVQLVTPGCATVENTATVASDVSDTNPANNSSTASNAVESVADGSFEDGSPNSFWAEASTNFGTPLCTAACGLGGGTGPNTGDWWAWFGGTTSPFEEGSVTQSVTIPVGATTLTFFLEVPNCDAGSGADDFMEVTVDGTQVFLVNGTSALCNVVGYTQQSVDISAFADDGVHTLEFHSITSTQIVNFFVDDVSLTSTTCVAGAFVYPLIQEIPTLGTYGFAALAGLLALAGLALVRRRAA